MSAQHRKDCPLHDGDECTLGSDRSPASFCRSNGWQPGTVLVGNEGLGEEHYVITAVGKRQILVRKEGDRDGWYETSLCLRYRCWVAVPTKNGAL